jgi:hypothetical protein
LKKIDKRSALLLFVAAGALAGCGGGGSGPGGGFVPSQSAEPMPASTAAAPAEATAAAAVEPAADKEAEALGKLDASWIKVANEGQTMSLAASTVVQYGANSSWTSRKLSGTVVCDNSTFGDPLQFVAKAYRFGDVIYPDASSGFCTQAGACPTLTHLGEFAGKLALPFKPTSVHSSNVP